MFVQRRQGQAVQFGFWFDALCWCIGYNALIYFQGSLGQPAGVRRAAAVSSGAGGLVASCTLLVHSVPCFNFVYYMVVNSGLSGLLCPLCLLHYGRALDTIYSPGGFLARCTLVLVWQHLGTLMALAFSRHTFSCLRLATFGLEAKL